MTKLTNTFLVALVVMLMVSTATAQPGGERGPGGRGPGGREPGREGGPGGFRPPANPVVIALDANKDGTISADEIKNAAAALKKLDKNNDGKLTREELRPQFRGGPGGRPRGEGGPRRPGDGEGRPRRPGGEGARPEGRPGGEGRPGPGGPGNFLQGFLARVDKNKDGKISKDEAPERMKERFAEIDTNKNGSIDKSELEKLFQRFRGRRPGGEGGERPRRPARPDDG